MEVEICLENEEEDIKYDTAGILNTVNDIMNDDSNNYKNEESNHVIEY
jgi:hypothetical protein